MTERRKVDGSAFHDFDPDLSTERKFGEIEVAISLKGKVAERFLADLTERVKKKETGIRFLFLGVGSIGLVKSKGSEFVIVQSFSHNDTYIFPNVSLKEDGTVRADKFTANYSRIEMYFPKQAWHDMDSITVSKIPVVGSSNDAWKQLGGTSK